MKRIFILLVIALPLLFVAGGCNRNQNKYMSNMVATIDTINLYTNTIKAGVIDSNATPQMVQVNAVSTLYTPGTAFLPQIQIIAPLIIGTYTLDSGSVASARAFTSVSGLQGSPAVSGTIVIGNIQDRFSGAFHFVCKDGTVVTGGQFITNYSK